MLDGFRTATVPTPRGGIHVRTAGDGPPLLLLHGYPQTHLMWHAAAPLLAERFSVVLADLPGYGDSFLPEPAAGHEPHAKRTMARDLVAAMAWLGHERFAVAGHDRGGRVAYRMALDAPERVSRLAVLDIVPTAEVWARADATFALGYWHWGFLAQGAPLPESLIGGDPDGFFEHHLLRIGIGSDPARYPQEVLDDYRRRLHDPEAVRGICEDYRAGATVDREHDEADRAGGRTIACPTLALWGANGAMPLFYGDLVEVWRAWAPDVRGHAIEASHFLVEDRPEEVAAALLAFLADG